MEALTVDTDHKQENYFIWYTYIFFFYQFIFLYTSSVQLKGDRTGDVLLVLTSGWCHMRSASIDLTLGFLYCITRDYYSYCHIFFLLLFFNRLYAFLSLLLFAISSIIFPLHQVLFPFSLSYHLVFFIFSFLYNFLLQHSHILVPWPFLSSLLYI